jgi:hypothetical protein
VDEDEIDALFNARYWTLEQALSWMLTRDQELVVRNSGEALTALVAEYQLGTSHHEPPRTPLAQFLDEGHEARQAYRRCMRDLYRNLKEGRLRALGELKSFRHRVEIEPQHWIDYTIAHGSDGLLSDRRFDEPSSQDSGRYRRIRLERTDILKIWPLEQPDAPEKAAARKQTNALRRRAVDWIGELIETNRDNPIKRETVIEMVIEQIPGLKPRAAREARAQAIKEKNAKNWGGAWSTAKIVIDKIDKK